MGCNLSVESWDPSEVLGAAWLSIAARLSSMWSGQDAMAGSSAGIGGLDSGRSPDDAVGSKQLVSGMWSSRPLLRSKELLPGRGVEASWGKGCSAKHMGVM